ncbi:MAG: SH3 domain-containing protein [Clostridia bacterium]|nr:SH3 domain-containing protein [Clostridia bacterium]
MNHNPMKKLASLTAAAALAMTSTAALAAAPDSALVQGGGLNLRETPSLAAKVLGQFPTGTLVEITGYHGDWNEVEVNGLSGYMMAKFLNASQTAQTATVRTNSGIGLNLREEPGMNGTILTSVKNGGSVTVTQKGREWSRVNVNGTEGFMATEFLRFGAQSSGTVTGQTAVVNNPRDTQVLNLRQGPSLDSKVLDYYRNGTEVVILKAGSTWHKVQVSDGKVGYMMASFLKPTGSTGEAKPFEAKLINVNGGSYVNFRKGASLKSSVIARLPVGGTVTVLEHGTDWCKVTVDGVTGYVSTWFMTF